MTWIVHCLCLTVTLGTLGWAVDAWPGLESAEPQRIESSRPALRGPAEPAPWSAATNLAHEEGS